MLEQLLARSGATESFRAAVAEFRSTARANDRVRFDAYSPPVKVERTLTKLLEAYPELPIDRVEIQGTSGCEFYRGHLVVHTASETRRVRFHWDCRWRAQQEGWTDYFGFPDQMRAAMEFGHDCFRVWEEEPQVEPAGA